VTGLTDVTCVADEDLIRRLVGNLVDNAIKYSRAGSPIVVSLERAGAMHRITVSDRGPGIDREAQARVFERFFRADKSRTRGNDASFGGGLGLAIALWIARAHGGTLELVTSGPDGTVFAAELPCGGRL
jgi:two-component system OmpR family sensor kinase